MKSLFIQDEDPINRYRYNADGQALDTETHKAISAVFEKFVEDGFSPREISHIMQSSIMEHELEAIILPYDEKKS
jgi:hypothetical protein